jgi:hypothetical protein
VADPSAEGGSPPPVEIYTDGACKGNPGPGGWGALLRWGQHEKELCGGERDTTNNRMELMAVIQALEALTAAGARRDSVDSRYVQDGVERWMPRWKRNGWQTKRAQAGQEPGPLATTGSGARAAPRAAGVGSRATVGIRATSARINSPTAASRRAAEAPPVTQGRGQLRRGGPGPDLIG